MSAERQQIIVRFKWWAWPAIRGVMLLQWLTGWQWARLGRFVANHAATIASERTL